MSAERKVVITCDGDRHTGYCMDNKDEAFDRPCTVAQARAYLREEAGWTKRGKGRDVEDVCPRCSQDDSP